MWRERRAPEVLDIGEHQIFDVGDNTLLYLPPVLFSLVKQDLEGSCSIREDLFRPLFGP